MRTAPTGLQKGKYRCARVTTLAGLHVSNSPSACTLEDQTQ